MADELLGGILGSIVTNGSQTNQILGQILQALQNQGSFAGTGAVTSSSPTAGMGYATGAGGTVTQATSKTTGVTLNKVTGQITMNNAALGAGSEATFTVTNSTVATADVPFVVHCSGGTAGAYGVFANSVAAGSFAITVTNLSAGPLSEAIVLQYAIIKGATA